MKSRSPGPGLVTTVVDNSDMLNKWHLTYISSYNKTNIQKVAFFKSDGQILSVKLWQDYCKQGVTIYDLSFIKSLFMSHWHHVHFLCPSPLFSPKIILYIRDIYQIIQQYFTFTWNNFQCIHINFILASFCLQKSKCQVVQPSNHICWLSKTIKKGNIVIYNVLMT